MLTLSLHGWAVTNDGNWLIGISCVYAYYLHRGSRDGFGAKDFHTHCDNKGENVILLRHKNRDLSENIFGAYVSQNWQSIFCISFSLSLTML